MKNTSKYKKVIFKSIIAIILFHTVSFFFFSEQRLIKHIGDNFETTIYKYKDNSFDNVSFVSSLISSEMQIKEHFELFENDHIRFCDNYITFKSLRDADFYYFTFELLNDRNPFIINKVSEAEFAESYGAIWESKYLWILFDWVLVEKELVGQS